MSNQKKLACLALTAVLGIGIVAQADTTTNIVAQLSSAHWTQGEPYNDYSPKGTAFASGWEAGCVAIAAAQELYNWQWPWSLGAVRETSHPVLNESNLALRFDGNVPFDWENMPDSFSSGGTLTQKHAVAHLVLACQSLVQMQFVSAGGEAKKNLPGTMEWFEFDRQIDPKSGNDAIAALRADFEFGSPVQTGINFKGYGGHEVVGLGFATTSGDEEKNLIWLNLGWGGGSDGWYDLSEIDASETVIKSVQLGFRPIKSVQIEPIAPVSGSEATIKWHLPKCYEDKISGFTVATKKLGSATTTWSDDFSTAKGRSNNANEVRIVNGALKAWDGTASGMYLWDEVFVPTADSELTYDVGSSYMSGMSVRFEAKVDGAWQTINTVAVNGDKEVNYYNWGTTTSADPVSLASLDGKPIQLRYVVEYTNGSIYSSDDASVKIDNLSISNVKTFADVSSSTINDAATRENTFTGLESGEVYAFTVTPVMSDESAAVTQTVTTTIGTPAASPVIGTVTMSPRGTDLMQEGFYTDIAMGWNIINVACQNVETLEAFPSHQSVLPQSKVEVVNNSNGSFSINIDATEVAAKWAGQRMILTLKATNETGETTYKDLELRLVASGVPENVPGGKVWTGEDGFFGENYTAKWANNDLPSNGDKATFYVADGYYGAMMNLNLTSATELGYVNATGEGQLTISGTSSEVLTIDTFKNDVQVEVNSTKLKIKKAVPSANLVIDSGSSLDCEIDQSRSSFIKKVSGGYVSALTDSSLWKGTVVFEGYSADTLNLNNYGNDNSRVLLNGVSGWLSYNTTVNPTVELVDSGTTPALHWNNGSGSSVSTFKSLVGTGTFKTSTPSKGGNERLKITSLEGFGGSFDLASKTVVIGSDVGTYTNNGRMNVNSGNDVIIAAGKTWNIGGGMYLGGNQTITVNGTLNGAITAEGTGTTLALKPTSAVTAESLNMANNTISIEKSAAAASAVTVSGAANLAGTTLAVTLTGEAANSIALMSAGSFTGVDSATLTGLDGYTLNVDNGVLYAKSLNPSYDGPKPVAVWVAGEFEDAASEHGGYSIVLPSSGISVSDGKLVVASDATIGATIDLSSASANKITVLIEYSSLAAVSGKNVTLATVNDSESHVIGARTTANGALTLTGYYDASSDNDYAFGAVPTVPAGTGYLMFMYDNTTDNDINGTYCYAGNSIDALVGGRNSSLKWTGNSRKINAVSIGGPITSTRVAAWSGVKIEKVALFVGEALTGADVVYYKFPEVPAPEEPTVVARLVVDSATAGTYATLNEALNALAMQLFLNPTADVYVEVVDDELATPNEYGSSGIGYSETERKYARAVTKLDNGTATYPAFLNLADAWAAAGKGADTAIITVLSDPVDAVVVGAGQTIRVIAGTVDLSDNISFAAGLATSSWTLNDVTTYTARELNATVPGMNTNVGMTASDFALDSTGEWAQIVDKPIYLTLASPVRRFKLSFDVDIPDGVYGTLFSWDSTNSDKSVDSRVVVTNDASKMVIYRKNDGTLSTVGYSESTLITSGQHTITVQWVHNAGCTIYLDGNKSYSSSNLAFTDHDTATLAIGGSALGSPDDVLAGLKVRNFTYIVYSDVVTRLDGTIYHGNDENRAVITNYLSQMVGSRPVKMPAPNTVDLLLVYDPNAVNYATNRYATVEEHAAHNVAVMNQALTTTDIDTNAWFRIAGIYQVDVAAANVDDALAKLNSGTAEGWDQVNAMRDQVGADVVLGVVYTDSNYGLANWCSPTEIMNGGGANYAFAGVRADAAWSWVHEVGHTASLYHSPGEAAGSYNNPTSIGCGFSKTAEADMAELRSIMASGTAQLAFSSPNHKSHGEIYSVTNAVGEYVDSSGELARLLPYMAKYRDTEVNAWTITPQSGSTVTSGDTMTVTCEDSGATIWYSLYGEETETQYDGPVAINTSSSWCIYNVTIKKGDETVVTTQVTYTVDQTQADPVAKIGDTPYDSLADAVAAATASSAESVEISLLKASFESVTLDAKTTITEASSGLYTGTLSGSGTLVLAGTRSSALSFNNWTGTVVLPELASIAGDTFNFNYYGVEGSTVRINGIGGGWLKNEVINPKIDIPAGKTLTISVFSASFANTFKALSGAGTLSFTYNTAINTMAGDWYPGYSAYYLIQDVSGFTGSLSTATPGIAIGTTKPHYQTAGGKILVYTPVTATADWTAPNGVALADADATLTVEDGVTVSAVSTTIPGYGVVRSGNVYSVDQVTNTDYSVPYSWFSSYDRTDAFSSPEDKAANGKNSWWECYVLGLDPTNATSKFVTTIRMDGATPVVEYSPTNNTIDIQYVLQGKPALSNDWQDVEFNEPGDTNRFFRVEVRW